MKTLKTLTILVILSILQIQNLSAQFIHEFSVDGGIGLSSTLRYQLSSGNRSGSMGGDFGVGYTFFSAKERVTGTERVFRELWGIHTGIGVGMYNAKSNLDGVKNEIKGLSDGDLVYDMFDLRTTLNRYNETQKTMFLNIPVMALFQIEQIYIMGGLKFGIPVNGKYSSKDATLTNKAYYHDLENEIDAPAFRGLGKFDNMNYNGDLELGLAVMLALEAGYKWHIADNLSVYTGLYFDCGLNNTAKGDKNQPFVNYNPQNQPENFSTNSALSSFTDKAKPMAVGIRLRFAMEK